MELPATDTPLEELLNHLRRTYRRVCLLRATGRHAEALDLEIDDLSLALSAARDGGASERATAAAMAEEAERVANAATLAEVLAPLLAEKLRATPALASSAAAVPAAVSSRSSAPAPPPPSSSPAPSAPAKPAPAASPSITDLLDGMFAQAAPSPGASARP